MKTNDRLAPCNRLSFHNHWLVLVFCLAGTIVHAANRTWDAGGTDGYWSTPANWDGDATAPVSGDALFFGGSTWLYNTNDLAAGTSFAGITFNTNADAFVITGAAITLGGNVTNKCASNQTLNLSMDLNATRTFTTPSPYLGSITVGGDLSGAGGLIKSGTRALTLSGVNTFTGGVTMNDGGTLTLSGVSAFKGGLTINAGTANLRGSFDGMGGVVSIYSGAGLAFGPGTLTNDIVNNGTVGPLDVPGTLTLSGLISGTGVLNLGQGIRLAQYVLSCTNNSYTGKTSIKGPGAVTSFLQVTKLANGGQNSSIGASSSSASNLVLESNLTYLRYVGPGDTTDRLLTLKGTGEIGIENNGTGPLSFTSTGSISNSTANITNTFLLGGSYAGEANTFAPSIVDNGNVIRLTKSGAGTWVLTGANTYSGLTTISGGVLGLTGAGTLGSGNLTINGGLLESSSDFARALGTSSGEMQITGGASGFSARGNPINVAFGTVGSPTALAWGGATFAPSPLVLNSTLADSKLTFRNPIDLNTTAAGVTRTIQVNTNVAEMSGALTQSGAGGANLSKTGAGTLILSGNSTMSNVTVSAGALTMIGTNTFNNLTVSAGSVTLTGTNTFKDATVSAGAALTVSGANTFSNLTSSGTATLTGTNTFNNVTISGGTLTLGGSKVPGGTMTFSNGNLVLDYTVENSDKLDPTKGLTLGSANNTAGLTIVGNPTPYTQTINGLTLAGTAHTIAMSKKTALSLGSISRAAGIGALVITNSGSGAISTTSGTANSILTNDYGVAYATYNGDWAAKDGSGNLVGLSTIGYTDMPAYAADKDANITADVTAPAGARFNSIRFNTTGATTLTLGGVTTNSTGGILVTPNVGMNLTKITGGTIKPNGIASGRELVVIQNNTNGDLQIDSVLANNTAASSVTKAGPGKLILTTNNTMTGYIYLNAGTVQFGDGTTTGKLVMSSAGIKAQNGTTLRVAGGVGGLTVSNAAVLSCSGGPVTIDVGTNCVFNVGGGGSGLTGGGSLVKTGTGTFKADGRGVIAGWIKEGTFIANSGADYFLYGVTTTIGDTAPGALPATVFLLNTTRANDNFGTSTTYINRTGIIDYNNQSIQLGVNPTFVGGGTVTSTHASPGTATLQGNVTYNATNSSDVGATISVVPLALGAARTFTINDSAYVDTEMTISSDISGAYKLTKDGAGTMALSGVNTYTGTNIVSAGTLIAKKPASLPNYNVANMVAVSAAATLAVNAGGAGEWAAADIDTLRANASLAANAFLGIDTTGGNFTYGSVIADGLGALGFRKLGTNTLTLTAANTYTGGTRIEKGTLVASNANALSTSGTITVYSNALFGVGAGVTFSRGVTFHAGSGLTGNGTFAGGLICPANFTVAPGLPTGTLTVNGAVTLAANNTLRIAFQPDGTYGKLSVTGALDISNPMARLVLTGKPPAGKTVLAEGTTLNGTFLEANIDMTGLHSPKGVIRYENNKVILASAPSGTLYTMR